MFGNHPEVRSERSNTRYRGEGLSYGWGDLVDLGGWLEERSKLTSKHYWRKLFFVRFFLFRSDGEFATFAPFGSRPIAPDS